MLLDVSEHSDGDIDRRQPCGKFHVVTILGLSHEIDFVNPFFGGQNCSQVLVVIQTKYEWLPEKKSNVDPFINLLKKKSN